MSMYLSTWVIEQTNSYYYLLLNVINFCEHAQ